jgi:3-oxoacyl-[acyl-carrier protein] reductase
MASLKGKVAVVTGASRGIGRGIAERLARDGASLVVNYIKNSDEAKKVVAGIEGQRGNAVTVQADIGEVADIRRLFQETENTFGRLDIVVNNAGIFSAKPLTDVTEEEYDHIFAVNAKGQFFAMQEAAKRMADGGRIVNISTVGTRLTLPSTSVAGGAKSAMEFFTRVAAKEQVRALGIQTSPLGRLGTPKDIADAVAILVSDEGGWITGNIVQAGGGVVV